MPNENKKNNVLQNLLLIMLAAGVGMAKAAIIDQPSFTVAGVVIVWGGDGAGGASVNDFIIANSDGSSVDLIESDVTPVITGSLDSFSSITSGSLDVTGQTLDDQGVIGALDAGDSFSAFSPSETITSSIPALSSSFYVASNTAFSIRAVATLDTENSSENARLGDITRYMTISRQGTDAEGTLSYGNSAQLPYSGNASEAIINNGFLSKLSTEKAVFQGDRATANGTGTLADQSVRFTNTYEMADGDGFEYGTRKVAARVVYTVAIP